MATVKGVVEAVSTKWDKYTIQVNGNWYGTKMEWATVKPNKGDVVEFDDGGGKYTKNIKIVTKGPESGPSTGYSGAAKGSYSSLGVELGHAANLAMQVTLESHKKDIGSTEFYKDFVSHTRTIKAIMQGLRNEYEGGTVPAEVDDSVVVMKTTEKKEVTAEDIF